MRPATLLKKGTLAQMFSCESSEPLRNSSFKRAPQVAAYYCLDLQFLLLIPYASAAFLEKGLTKLIR